MYTHFSWYNNTITLTTVIIMLKTITSILIMVTVQIVWYYISKKVKTGDTYLGITKIAQWVLKSFVSVNFYKDDLMIRRNVIIILFFYSIFTLPMKYNCCGVNFNSRDVYSSHGKCKIPIHYTHPLLWFPNIMNNFLKLWKN